MGMGGSNYRPNMINQRFGTMPPGMPPNMQPGQMPGMRPSPGMQPGMGMDRLNGPQNQFNPSFMNSMPPGMFPNSPHGAFPGQPNHMTGPNSGPGNQPGSQPGNTGNTESDVGEILALFDDNPMHSTSSQVKNEPTQCGVCKQQVISPFKLKKTCDETRLL